MAARARTAVGAGACRQETVAACDAAGQANSDAPWPRRCVVAAATRKKVCGGAAAGAGERGGSVGVSFAPSTSLRFLSCPLGGCLGDWGRKSRRPIFRLPDAVIPPWPPERVESDHRDFRPRTFHWVPGALRLRREGAETCARLSEDANSGSSCPHGTMGAGACRQETVAACDAAGQANIITLPSHAPKMKRLLTAARRCRACSLLALLATPFRIPRARRSLLIAN